MWIMKQFCAGYLENKLAMRLCSLAQFATEAAITILRIDDMIRLEKSEEDMEG